MSWYKFAKIQKQALKIEDLEEFYLIATITKDKILYLLKKDEDFKNYIIKKMEYFKKKYLKDGVFAINEELFYINENVETSINGLYRALNLFRDKKKWTEKGFTREFGGEGWSRVTKALIAIVEFPNLYKINLTNNEVLAANIYRLIFLIDHFNNISHNTGLALPKMMDKYQNISALVSGDWKKVRDKNLLEQYKQNLISPEFLADLQNQVKEEAIDFLDMKADVDTDMRDILISPIQKIDNELIRALNEVGESVQSFNNPKQVLEYYKSKKQLTYEVFNKILPSLFNSKDQKDIDFWRISEDHSDFFNRSILDAIENKNAHLIWEFINIYFKLSSSVKDFVDIDELVEIFINIAENIGYKRDILWLYFQLQSMMNKKVKEEIFIRIFNSSIIKKDFKSLYYYLRYTCPIEDKISSKKFTLILNTMMNCPDRLSSEKYNILSIMYLRGITHNVDQMKILYNALEKVLFENNHSNSEIIIFMEYYCHKFNLSFGKNFWESLLKEISNRAEKSKIFKEAIINALEIKCPNVKNEIEKYLYRGNTSL